MGKATDAKPKARAQQGEDVIDLDPKVPASRAKPTGSGFRPSDLEKKIAQYAKQHGISPEEVDRFRFLREHGLPNPTCLFRVSGRRGTKAGPIDYEPVEVEATDPADAILRAADQLGISYRDRHRVNFTVVVLEQ